MTDNKYVTSTLMIDYTCTTTNVTTTMTDNTCTTTNVTTTLTDNT